MVLTLQVTIRLTPGPSPKRKRDPSTSLRSAQDARSRLGEGRSTLDSAPPLLTAHPERSPARPERSRRIAGAVEGRRQEP